MYKIYGDVNSPCFTSDLLKILLKHKNVLITSIKRNEYNVKFTIDTTSEEELRVLLDELSNLEAFRITKIKERKWWF